MKSFLENYKPEDRDFLVGFKNLMIGMAGQEKNTQRLQEVVDYFYQLDRVQKECLVRGRV